MTLAEKLEVANSRKISSDTFKVLVKDISEHVRYAAIFQHGHEFPELVWTVRDESSLMVTRIVYRVLRNLNNLQHLQLLTSLSEKEKEEYERILNEH